MDEFEPSSMFGIGNGDVRAKLRRLESGMEELESNSDTWNREWRSSSLVRGLESEMEEFEPSLEV